MNVCLFKKTLLLITVMTLFSCSEKEIEPDFPKPDFPKQETTKPETANFVVREYSFHTDGNSKLMFQDDEGQEIMTSKARRYQIAKLIRVRPIDNLTIEVANFAPVDIEDVFITADMEGGGVESKIKLFKISKIRANTIQEIKYPFVDGDSKFMSVSGVIVDLSDYKTKGIPADKVTFDFMGDSELVKKLKTLSKLKFNIKYHDFDKKNNPKNNWSDDISPKDIRRFSGMLINMGYIFASKDFEEGFLKEHLIKNGGTTVMTTEEKKELYKKLINKKFLLCGKTVRVSGLGGGNTFGVSERVLSSYLTNPTAFSTPVHEFGHCLGYNHSSNMTYPKKVKGIRTGISPLIIRVAKNIHSKKGFPINTENYYKPDDFSK